MDQIKLNLRGRLGNQMFQYAFALAQSRLNNTDFSLYPTNHKMLLSKYFILSADNTSDIVYSLRYYLGQFLRLLRKYLWLSLKPQPEIIPNSNIDYSLNVIQNRLTQGYFQSDMYFINYINDIRNEFKIKERWTNQFKTKYDFLLSMNYIAIHIRKGDYASFQIPEMNIQNVNLPLEFYHEAIRLLKKPNNSLVFVTDDKEYVTNFFSMYRDKIVISDYEIIDFQVLLNARSCIIANSSFSWWAAYLNNSKDKKVIAPRNWLGYNVGIEYPKGIMTDNFNWI